MCCAQAIFGELPREEDVTVADRERGGILLIAQAATAQTYTQGKGSIPILPPRIRRVTARGESGAHDHWRKNSDPSLASSFAPVALVAARQPCIHYLRRTGGLPLVTTLVLGGLVVMVGSSVVIRALMRQ